MGIDMEVEVPRKQVTANERNRRAPDREADVKEAGNYGGWIPSRVWLGEDPRKGAPPGQAPRE
jgi:hypothetical protein